MRANVIELVAATIEAFVVGDHQELQSTGSVARFSRDSSQNRRRSQLLQA